MCGRVGLRGGKREGIPVKGAYFRQMLGEPVFLIQPKVLFQSRPRTPHTVDLPAASTGDIEVVNNVITMTVIRCESSGSDREVRCFGCHIKLRCGIRAGRDPQAPPRCTKLTLRLTWQAGESTA